MTPYIPTRPSLIQNALYFPGHEHYMPSRHSHDYTTFEYLPGHCAMRDGGLDYVRAFVIPPEHEHLVIKWDLYDNDPIELVRDRLLWGSLPLDKTKPQVHTYRPIRLLAKDHLQAILDNVSKIAPLHKQVIEYWLTQP